MLPPAWHKEARRLYRDGVRLAHIAAAVGMSRSAVAYAVNHNNMRIRNCERVKKCVKRKREMALA